MNTWILYINIVFDLNITFLLFISKEIKTFSWVSKNTVGPRWGLVVLTDQRPPSGSVLAVGGPILSHPYSEGRDLYPASEAGAQKAASSPHGMTFQAFQLGSYN